jgi:hypothetical protein
MTAEDAGRMLSTETNAARERRGRDQQREHARLSSVVSRPNQNFNPSAMRTVLIWMWSS